MRKSTKIRFKMFMSSVLVSAGTFWFVTKVQETVIDGSLLISSLIALGLVWAGWKISK